MSQENVEIVRKPLRLRERSSRTLAQRLALLLPRLNDSSLRLIAKRPPTSRIRQAAIWRGVPGCGRGMEPPRCRRLSDRLPPRLRALPPPEFVEAGLWESHYRGHAGYAKLMSELSDAGTDVRVEPIELRIWVERRLDANWVA